MFELLGFKWGTSAAAGTSGGQVEWSTSSGIYSELPKEAGYSNSDFDAALVEAFETWERVASIDFVRVNSGADLVLDASATTGSVVGFATIQDPNGDNIADSATIDFSNNLPGVGSDWSPFGGDGLNFFVVALHEIGHVMGLDHVEGTLQVMNSTLSSALSTLRGGDIDGAQFLYGKDAGDVDAVDAPDAPPPSDDPSADPGGDGGGGGGILLALLGLLAVVFGGFFGGGAAVLAASYDEDEGEDTGEEDSPSDLLLSDLLPTLPADDHDHDHENGVHVVRWDDSEDQLGWADLPTVNVHEDHTGHTPFGGCSCSFCHEQQQEEEMAADFLV